MSAATTGVTTLAVDLINNAFTRSAGDFLADGFAVGQEIIVKGFSLNNGRFTVLTVTATSLKVAEGLMFGDTTGSGDESIVSPGKLVFAGGGQFGAGLTSITITADEIVLLPGVTVSTRSTSGTDPRTDASTGNSGPITFNAGRIIVGRGAAIVAHGGGGFTGGVVTLTSDVTGPTTFDFFHLEGPQAVIELGTSALVTGGTVVISATATTGAPAELGDVVNDLFQVLPAGIGFFAALALIAANLDLLPDTIKDGFQVIADALEAAEGALRTAIGNDGVFELPSGVKAAAVFGRADAWVSVGSGGRIKSGGDVDLSARAVSAVNVTTLASAGYLGLSYASARPNAFVQLAMGSVITAGGDVELKATTDTTLALRTEVAASDAATGLSASFGKTESHSRVDVAAGAAITASNVSLIAETTRSISNVAIAAGFGDSASAGKGAVLAVGYYQSLAEAVLAGKVVATGAVALTATATETKNDTQSFGSVDAQPAGTERHRELRRPGRERAGHHRAGGRPQRRRHQRQRRPGHRRGDDAARVGEPRRHLDRRRRRHRRRLAHAHVDSRGPAPGHRGRSRRRSDVRHGDRRGHRLGQVREPGHVLRRLQRTGRRRARSHPRRDADLRGAVRRLRPERHDRHRRQLRRREHHGQQRRVRDGRTRRLPGRSARRPGQGRHQLRARLVGHRLGQRVLRWRELPRALHRGRRRHRGRRPGRGRGRRPHRCIHARGGSHRRPGVGAEPSRGPRRRADTAGGGYFSGVFAENYARTYIDDRAKVTTTRDITMDATTDSRVLNVAKQGQSGTGLAINGVFAFVVIDEEALAFIEDRATVAAGRDIDLEAVNKDRVVNVAGAQALGGTDAVGVAVAVTVIGTTDDFLGSPETLEDRAESDVDGASVRAFIGDATQLVGETPTGGVVGTVSAGRDLKLTATNGVSPNEIWTAAVGIAGSSAAETGNANLSSPDDSANNVDVSAAGSGAINVLDRSTQAYVRDMSALTVVRQLSLVATDTSLLVSSAGATIGTGSTTIGGSFALNDVDLKVYAFTTFVPVTAGGVSLSANAAATMLSFESTALTGGGSGLAIALSFNLDLADVGRSSPTSATRRPSASPGDVSLQATSSSTSSPTPAPPPSPRAMASASAPR